MIDTLPLLREIYTTTGNMLSMREIYQRGFSEEIFNAARIRGQVIVIDEDKYKALASVMIAGPGLDAIEEANNFG